MILQTSAQPVIFRARRPAALVYPLAAITELAGVATLLATHQLIGVFMCAAPVVALLSTAVLVRPSIELTQEGVLQKQYPFSVLTRWETIDHVGLTRAGNRIVLGYRLKEGLPPPKRQPAAALLRAAGRPFDGGWFADSLAAGPDAALAAVQNYLGDPQGRATLAPARR